MPEAKPITAALRKRCGVCNHGKVFRSRMQFKDRCDHCGQDFTIADTADGPAYFVGFAMLILVMPFAVVLPISKLSLGFKLLGYGILIGVTLFLILFLLPIVKAMFLNLQIFHKAGPADFE